MKEKNCQATRFVDFKRAGRLSVKDIFRPFIFSFKRLAQLSNRNWYDFLDLKRKRVSCVYIGARGASVEIPNVMLSESHL